MGKIDGGPISSTSENFGQQVVLIESPVFERKNSGKGYFLGAEEKLTRLIDQISKGILKPWTPGPGGMHVIHFTTIKFFNKI